MPNYRPSAAVTQFVQKQHQHVRALLSVCTGFLVALHSGIFDGKTATAPQGMLAGLKEEAPQVKWAEKRWVRDGKGMFFWFFFSRFFSCLTFLWLLLFLSNGELIRGGWLMFFSVGVVWSSGAVTNGLEMMAAFMREEFADRKEAVEMVLQMSDVAIRGEKYKA